MAKNKKQTNSDDITMSMDEFDEATLKQFYSGRLNGRYKCHDVFTDTFARLKQSLEDVWSIEILGLMNDEKKIRTEKLTFAIATLSTLEDMFFDEYDSRLGVMKGEAERMSPPMSEEELMDYLDNLDND